MAKKERVVRRKRERGAAGISIELSDGIVVVRRMDYGKAVLSKRIAYDGYWNNLWDAITNADLSKGKNVK